jgi:hypothetical protein
VAFGLLLSEAVAASRRESEAILVIPPLLAMSFMLTAFDGLYWASTAALFWFACGLLSQPATPPVHA